MLSQTIRFKSFVTRFKTRIFNSFSVPRCTRLSSMKLLIIFPISSVILFLYILTSVNTLRQAVIPRQLKENVHQHSSLAAQSKPEIQTNYVNVSIVQNEKQNSTMKYILQWSSPTNEPFVYMGTGQKVFIDKKCPHTNCFVTSDRNYLDDYARFDAIVFHGPEIVLAKKSDLPQKRSPHQKYIFGSMESSGNYPIKYKILDDFFNWTWTYKLNSDLTWGYIAIRNLSGDVIGPKTNMHWIKFEDMEPVSVEFKKKLQRKTKTAAWFVSNCKANRRKEKVISLQKALKAKYGRSIDIYGACGNLTCSRESDDECNKMIANDYFFYLSFENSFSEDYVTEKLLRALQNDVIPIVYGGANYSRFMPDGSYLYAVNQNVYELAAKMDELINDIDKYYEYFKWKKYYSYHKRGDTIDTDDYCALCTIMNDEEKVKKRTVYENFRKWWNPPGKNKGMAPGRPHRAKLVYF